MLIQRDPPTTTMHEPLLDNQRKEGGMSKLQILILAVCAFTLAVSVYTLIQVEKNGHSHTLNEVKSMLSSLQASASAAVFGVTKFAVPYVTPREYQEQRGYVVLIDEHRYCDLDRVKSFNLTVFFTTQYLLGLYYRRVSGALLPQAR